MLAGEAREAARESGSPCTRVGVSVYASRGQKPEWGFLTHLVASVRPDWDPP